MPSPIGHEIAGIAVYDAAGGLLGIGRKTRVLVLCLVLAVLPDFDFIPGLLTGEPDRYHHGLSHSIFVAALVSLVFATLFFSEERFKVFTVFFLVVTIGHLVLDMFSADNSRPYGLELFWPFSDGYYISGRTVFMDIRRSNKNSEFIVSLLSNGHNYRAAMREAAILLSVEFLVRVLVRTRRADV